ncbi:DUF4238 domain-containing protein [Conexibacter sp. W3-3-2]|uniref:DUF4238 domain-containing protein n=1 Tax=Conexibacter sp. W3-3-2 TaxID=2675227 RepID=UPI0012B939A1|nr:DUF4238 domain-containing protein [Conexibacter sp. W3-3-2]MTD47514.1 DUF4238 domain-containing protein [Conexibacter sp. W3-3-2]
MRASPLLRRIQELSTSGDFELLEKASAKRQHFVPQFTLRGFAEQDGRNYRLFQSDITTRRAPMRVDAREAASRRNLYRVRDEKGNLSNRNEGYLALIEEEAAPALLRLCESPDDFGIGDRATVALFLAVQTMRTPAAAAQVEAAANAAFRTYASSEFSDAAGFAERRRSEYPNESHAEIERLRLDTLDAIRHGRIRITTAEGGVFGEALRLAVEAMPMLIFCDWTLLHAPTGGFITSDRGMAIVDPTPPFPWQAETIFGSDSSETIFPLSDSYCLLVRPRGKRCGLRFQDAAAHEVEVCNLRTLGWADRHLFALRQATLEAVRASARRSPAQVPRPRTYCEVALIEPDPGDLSLRDENAARGWPAQVEHPSGEMWDYIVIPTDAPNEVVP